ARASASSTLEPMSVSRITRRGAMTGFLPRRARALSEADDDRAGHAVVESPMVAVEDDGGDQQAQQQGAGDDRDDAGTAAVEGGDADAHQTHAERHADRAHQQDVLDRQD